MRNRKNPGPRNGGSNRKRVTRRTVLASLGAGLVVPALRADPDTVTPASYRTPTVALDPTYNLKNVDKLQIAVEFNKKEQTIQLTVCRV